MSRVPPRGDIPTRIASEDDQGTLRRNFTATDRLGRLIGAQVELFSLTFEVVPDTERASRGGHWYVPPGVYLCFVPHATRNGKPYGALQSRRYFTSDEERAAAVEKYFRDAERRSRPRQRDLPGVRR